MQFRFTSTVKKITLASLICVVWVCGFSQRIEQTPKTLSATAQGRLARIDTLVQGYVGREWLTGAVSLVIHHNHILQYKAYGYQDAATRKPMPKDAIFRIASQTKAITSAGIMILYEQGKLTLDEPIADFIPEFRHPVVLDKFNAADSTYTTAPAKREITIRDLLTHSSGIDYAMIGTPAGNAIYAKAGIPSGLGTINQDLLERMRVLAKLPLMFQPGEKWMYGLSTDVLGCIIEVISAKSLEGFLRAEIFNPLGMNDTYFNVPAAKAARIASIYTEDSLHHIITWPKEAGGIDPDYPTASKHYFSGGAGLSSTALDYAIFLQMLLNGGIYSGHRILAKRTVALMTSGQLPFNFNGSDNFSLGFQVSSAQSAARNSRSEGSFGWGGFFGTTYWADPKEQLVGLFMTQVNSNSHGDIEPKFETMIYSSLSDQ